MPIETIIDQLNDFYAKHGKTKSMDYTFGFFDALAVLKELQKNNLNFIRLE